MRMRRVGVGLAFAGIVIGAGFASGQEILQFFSRHGASGTIGIFLTGFLLWLGGWRLLELGRRGLRSLPDLLDRAYRGRARAAVRRLLAACYLAALLAVGAAGGALLRGLLPMPAPWASLLVLIALLMAAALGVDGLIRLNAVVLPPLVAVLVLVAAHLPGAWSGPATPGWWASATVYASYNLFMSVAFLLPVGARLRSAGESAQAAAIGAATVAALALVVHRGILGSGVTGDLPLVQAISRAAPAYALPFRLMLLASVATTGVAQAFALLGQSRRYAWVVLLGWPATWLGLTAVVATLYPLMGVAAGALWWPAVHPGREDRQ
jgi:uncharacterized membrane protein YkvI